MIGGPPMSMKRTPDNPFDDPEVQAAVSAAAPQLHRTPPKNPRLTRMSDSMKRTPDMSDDEHDDETSKVKIWSWRFKVIVKFLFVFTLVICIGVVLDEDNDLEDREHVHFSNFCFLFTLLLLLPTAYEAGTSVYFWSDPDAIYNYKDSSTEEENVKEWYSDTFEGPSGFMVGIVIWIISLIASPFFVLFFVLEVITQFFLSMLFCRSGGCGGDDVKDEVENAIDHKLGILVGMLDAWQFTLLMPLAFIIITGSETKADALINTVAIQFLATLEDQFIGSLGTEERFEKFSDMVSQYKQPKKDTTPDEQMPSPRDLIRDMSRKLYD